MASCRRKTAPTGEQNSSTTAQTAVSGHTKQPSDVTHSKGESSGSKKRSSSVNEEGVQSNTSLTSPVEDNLDPPADGADSNGKLGVDCEEQCPRVQDDVEVQTIKQNDPRAPTLHSDSTLKAPEGNNCQASSDICANVEASSDDGRRRQDDKVAAKPQCPYQREVVIEPTRSDVVRTSTEDGDASTVLTPSDPLCADNGRNVAGMHVSVNSVDPDNPEDGVCRVRGYMHMSMYFSISSSCGYNNA